jgi:hypothetical protein
MLITVRRRRIYVFSDKLLAYPHRVGIADVAHALVRAVSRLSRHFEECNTSPCAAASEITASKIVPIDMPKSEKWDWCLYPFFQPNPADVRFLLP